MSDKVILVSGNFNVIHPGHMRLLRYARECGERLVVAVYSDNMAGKYAHVPEALRLEGVRSISWVDEAMLIDEPIERVITRLKPDIVVKGKEHESAYNPEQAAVELYGGRLLFSSGEAVFSSVDLLRKEFLQPDLRTISLPQGFMQRHDISVTRLHDLLSLFTR
ncbi:MAG: ADP-heptose synthase, partial [Betaproteobacteria bacterium]|nr:ADP-heptose synthase [Betaproteobacteria bacterium]